MRVDARLKGLITSTCLAKGPAARVRTLGHDAVIESRPVQWDDSTRETRRS